MTTPVKRNLQAGMTRQLGPFMTNLLGRPNTIDWHFTDILESISTSYRAKPK